ncbi:MAG: hypothetical protein JXQ93_07095 [Flavobacteriaceae bacterium]
MITQVGGIIYLIAILLISKRKKNYLLKRSISFVILYSISTFLIVPLIAPLTGRMKIEDISRIQSHSFMTKLCNRNYAIKEMHEVITDVSLRLQKEYPGIKLIYLDANFPFFDGFPLLPHLSHNDGKKIDIAFIYEDQNGLITNLKKSNSGYGIYEVPNTLEFDQNKHCKEEGFWQYDFSKHLTFGSINEKLKFSNKANAVLLNFIIDLPEVEKIFIEPHLKNRLKLSSTKVRFQGCRSVRHDDHIHLQIR